MHSGQHIKVANNQRKLKTIGLVAGQLATLTPVGAQVGEHVELPIEAVSNTSVTIDGNEYQDYMGSLVSYNGKLHTLDLPSPEPAVAA